MTTTERLAREFARHLFDGLSHYERREIRRRNRDRNDDTCASHDFSDANMDMHAAFIRVIGRDPLPEEGDMSDADIDLWNAAWTVAKRRHLTARYPS